MKKAAYKMLDIIRDIVIQELQREDNIVLCQVTRRVDDVHYDLVDAADETNVLHNIVNSTTQDFKDGDYIYLYKINNSFAQSFIVSRILPYVDQKTALIQAQEIKKRVFGYLMGYTTPGSPLDRGYPLGGTDIGFSSLLGYEEN